MSDILALLFLFIVAWYWWDTIRAKEIARHAGRNACEKAELQFLDDTVAKQKIWLKRNSRGQLHFCRLYTFEFTHFGDKRYKGEIILSGKQVNEIQMDAYQI